MIRFAHVPASSDVEVIDRPGAPFLGTGEASQGPAGAALANAVADATGVRIREIPFNPPRVRAAPPAASGHPTPARAPAPAPAPPAATNECNPRRP